MSTAIHHQCDLGLEPEVCFQYFTAPHLLTLWLCDDALVEPFEGGAFTLIWHQSPHTVLAPGRMAPAGIEPSEATYHKQGTVSAFAINRFIAFYWLGPSALGLDLSQIDPPTHVCIAFHDTPEHHTEVHLVHSGWPTTDEGLALKNWYMDFWKRAFSRLEMHLQAQWR